MWDDASATSTAASRAGVVGLAYLSCICLNQYKFSIVEELNAFRYIGVKDIFFCFNSNRLERFSIFYLGGNT